MDRTDLIPEGKKLKENYESYSDQALTRAIIDGRDVFDDVKEIENSELEVENFEKVEKEENVHEKEEVQEEKEITEEVNENETEKPEKNKEEQNEEPKENITEEEHVNNENSEDFENFVNETGLSVEQYRKLPEDVQEKVVEKFLDSSKAKSDSKEYKNKLDEVKNVLSSLESDPYISSRINQIKSGYNRNNNAPQITDNELKSIYDAETPEQAKAALDQLLKSKYVQGVESEWKFYQAQQEQNKNESEGFKAFLDMGKIDPRLNVDIKETNFNKLLTEYTTHPEWNKIENSPLKDVITFYHDKDFTWEQVAKLGSKSLYSLYASEKGWDKQAIENTIKNKKQEWLNKLRNPKKAPSPSGDVVKKSKGTFDGFDLEKMRNSEYVSKLLKQNEYDSTMRGRIMRARNKAYEN